MIYFQALDKHSKCPEIWYDEYEMFGIQISWRYVIHYSAKDAKRRKIHSKICGRIVNSADRSKQVNERGLIVNSKKWTHIASMYVMYIGDITVIYLLHEHSSATYMRFQRMGKQRGLIVLREQSTSSHPNRLLTNKTMDLATENLCWSTS